jgi:LysM repeat protein/ABC-type branched-subunit amino acid transport system substrate-binding protein
LVIPLDAKAQELEIRPSDMTKGGDLKISVSEALEKINDSTDVASSREPVRFTAHRVHRKETLFGIAKQYEVTEENIKHYNPELYGSQLKKGMRLRIPVFAEPVAEETGPDPENFEIYMVQPKETRWSIAHSYGITIDSLLALNPELSPANNGLPIGQQLLLPKKPGSTVEDQKVDLFVSYTVPPKMTLYSLSREFNVPQETIIKLNPEVVSQNGLREGMVLRLPAKKAPEMAVNTDNYVFYDVKPKQTTYSLTRNLGISYQELLQLNPALANGLKAGMVLKIPKTEVSGREIRNSLILDKINLIDSIHTEYRPRLVFMLPFRLDRINLSDTENASRSIENRNDIKYSLGLYSGALVALDSISRLGVSVDVATYDNELSLAKTKEILRKESLEGVSAVFGPLDQPSMEEVAGQAALYKVPVISPVPLASGISLNNVFFSYTSDDVLRKRMLRYMKGKVTDQNIIVIADGKNKAVKDTILASFPQARAVNVKEEEKNISVDLDQFTAMLSTEKENWAFVETDNYKLISSVTSILNSAITDTTQVRMFTTNKSKAFDNDVISGSHLSNLKFTYPSVYREAGSDAFVRRYKARFGSDPDRYAVRGFDLTFDLLLKLAYMPDLFDASGRIGATEYVGNKFDYTRDFQTGYFNQATYIMMYDNMHIKEVKDDSL